MEVRPHTLVITYILGLISSGSMLTFIVAIGYICFHTSTAQRAITAVVSGIVFSAVAWEITVHWKSSHPRGYYILQARNLALRIKLQLMRLSCMH